MLVLQFNMRLHRLVSVIESIEDSIMWPHILHFEVRVNMYLLLIFFGILLSSHKGIYNMHSLSSVAGKPSSSYSWIASLLC